jgi:outer membrane lipoprotein SlyB
MDPVTQTPRPRLHPLVIAAAVSIIALSGVGIATLLNSRSEAQPSNAPAVAMSSPTTATSTDATAPSQGVAPPPAGFDNTAPLPGAPETPPAQFAPAVGAQGAAPAPLPVAQAPACVDCATVEAIRPIEVRGESTGVGAVGGGLAGGLIGHSIGNGRGNVALTILGVAGGAVAGNAIEKNARSRTEYQLVLRYPSGRERFFTHVQPWPYNVGDTVRIVNGRVVALR